VEAMAMKAVDSSSVRMIDLLIVSKRRYDRVR
jgi:hypothetical protein